jgi:hypothetical protein
MHDIKHPWAVAALDERDQAQRKLWYPVRDRDLKGDDWEMAIASSETSKQPVPPAWRPETASQCNRGPGSNEGRGMY